MTGVHALLDLTLARGSARLETLTSRCLRRNPFALANVERRYAHQSVSLDNVSPSEYPPLDQDDRSFYSRRQASRPRLSPLESPTLFMPNTPMTTLEKRVAELKETPVNEAQIQEEGPPPISDADLTSMYEDLLAVPSHTQPHQNVAVDLEAQKSVDEAAVRGAVQSLYALEGSHNIAADIKSQYTAAISKLREVVEALELAQDGSGNLAVSVPILAQEDWTSLVRICTEEQDGPAAETVIDLMKRSGSSVPEVALTMVASLHANIGDVANTERFLATYVGPSPSEPLRDIHIKAHIRALQPRTFPTHALTLLHDYETRGLPAPQQSYTRLIITLLSLRSSMAEAQAWDLFSHMRYVAHPNPDAVLYTVMISVCASRVIAPQPARALDLFTEMTVDQRIAPTAAAYTATIYACARSGEKLYVGEAFRLAKEMLDGNRDAYGNPAFTPDRKTFCALLEGAKRTGDLAKVRWILAEIVALGLRVARGDVRNLVAVDEEIMMHVFHAYATYRTPFVRASAPLVEQDGEAPSDVETPASADSNVTAIQPADEGEATGEQARLELPTESRTDHFTAILPQSHAEVLYETRALFARIVRTASPDEDPMLHAFSLVKLTPRVLNAFLSVHYAHALFGESVQLYRTIFAEHGVEKNAWTPVEALERASRAKRGPERVDSLRFAREVWADWQPMEEAWWRREGRNEARVDARLVERAYVAMIRVLSRSGCTKEAVRLVRAFVDRYPPSMIKTPNAKPILRSTRTVLLAQRPIVRTMSPTEVPDDTVPPLLTFPELEVLHHNLVAIGDRESIGYIKYVCMSYQGALKRRKEAALHSKPVMDAVGPGAPKDRDTRGTQERT